MNQIYLYGGCATRDTFEDIELKHEFKILRYFARTIPASFSLDPFDFTKSPMLKGQNPSSDFKSRIFADDLNRNFLKISESEFDFIVMDFGTASYQNLFEINGEIGTLSSYALEFLKESNTEYRTIKNWSPEYIELHNQGMEKFLNLFSEKKVIINKIYYGNGAPGQNEDVKIRVNSRLNYIYDQISNSGKIKNLSFICYPEELLALDLQHKWGVGFFHFKKDFYDHQKAEFLKIIGRDQ